MRIDNSFLNLSLSENMVSDIFSLKEGQIFQARINQIIDDVIFLDLGNGKLLKAKTMISTILKDSSSVFNFIVKETNRDKIIIKPLSENEIDTSIREEKETEIVEILKKSNLEPDKEKIELIKELIENKIPVTKKIVQEMYQSKLIFQKIDSEIQNKLLFIHESDLNKNIFEFAKSFLEKVDEYFLEESELQLFADEKLYDLSDIKTVNIRNVDFQKLIFLFKNNFKFSLGNITQLNNIILKECSMAKQVQDLVNLLQQKSETLDLAQDLISTLEKIKSITIEKKFQPNEIIKDLEIKLEIIKETIKNVPKANIKEILKNIRVLQKGFEFMHQMNKSEIYLQIPIFIKQQFRDLDLFILKDNKDKQKINFKDCKILLSLDTYNLKKVRVLAEIKVKTIYCNFYIETKKIQSIIQKYENYLRNSLSSLDFELIHINYIVTNINNNILDFESKLNQNVSKTNFINLRV